MINVSFAALKWSIISAKLQSLVFSGRSIVLNISRSFKHPLMLNISFIPVLAVITAFLSRPKTQMIADAHWMTRKVKT